MTLFLIDASHHQSGLPVASLRGQGFPALILKASENTGFTDPAFAGFLGAARKAGLLVAAYHFLHEGNLPQQAALTRSVVPTDIPVWVDVERFVYQDGTVSNPTRDDAYVYADALRARGGRVGGIYHGAQPKAGYGCWWRPAYLSDPTGSAIATYAFQGGDAGGPWSAGQSRHPDIWQYCQHGRVPGFSGDVDFNAYRGTLDQLASSGWFWVPPGLTPPEVDMPLTADDAPIVQAAALAAIKAYFEHGPTTDFGDGATSPPLRALWQAAKQSLLAKTAAQAAGTLLTAVAADVDALQAASPGGVDVDAIAARITAALSDELATVLLDRLRARLEA